MLLTHFSRRYERSGKVVDAELRSYFREPQSEFQEDQAQVAERCMKLAANAEGGLPWVKLKSPALVDLWMQHSQAGAGGCSIATGKAQCVIDTPALNAVAWYSMVDGRSSMLTSTEQGDLARLILAKHSKYDITWAVVKRARFSLHNREFVARQICFKDELGRLVVAFEQPQEDVVVDYGRRMNAVRVRAMGFVRFTPIVGGAQCKLELYQQVDTGRRAAALLANSKAGQALSFVADMRERFQRDDEVDEDEQHELAAVIREEPQVYEAEEEQLITRVQDKLGGLKAEDFKELDSPDQNVKMHSILVEGSSTGVLRASTVRRQPHYRSFYPPPADSRLSADRRRTHLRGGRMGDGQDEPGEHEGSRRVRGP